MLGDSGFRGERDFAPGFAMAVERAQASDIDQDAASRQYRAKRVEQGQAAMISRRGVEAAVRQVIADGEQHDRCLVDHRGLEQGRVERPQVRAVGGRAFGKQADAIAVRQQFGGLLNDGGGVMAPFALNKQGAALLRQKADERPAAHIGLGNEARRANGIEQPNIQPRHMVRDQDHAARVQVGHVAVQLAFDAKNPEHFLRPALRDAVMPRFWGDAKDDAGNEDAPDQMQTDAQDAP